MGIRRPGTPLWNFFGIAMLIIFNSGQWNTNNSAAAWTTSFTFSRTTLFRQEKLLPGRRRRPYHLTTHLHSKKNIDQDPRSNDTFAPISLERLGILAQPIVGISLISVATTGGGLPAGPLGLVGALEGLAYVVVVLLALPALFLPSNERTTSQQLSLFTVGWGFLVLFLVITTQGCIPNAKPLLDYSAYIRVCEPN